MTAQQEAAHEVRVTPGPESWLQALGAVENRVEDRMRVLEDRVRMLTSVLAEIVADRYGEMCPPEPDEGEDEEQS